MTDFIYTKGFMDHKRVNNLNYPVYQLTNGPYKGTWGFGEYYNYNTHEDAGEAQNRLRAICWATKQPEDEETEKQYIARMTERFPFTA